MMRVYSGNLVLSKDLSTKRWQVSKEESGMRLLQYLRSKLEVECSLRFLKQSLERNLCRINGRVERFASTLVGRGDKIEFFIEQQSGQKSPVIKKSFSILYEDDDFLCIDKPAFVSSDDVKLIEILKKERALKYLELAHRLDKETSGVLIMIKSAQAKEAILRLFKERQITKSYFALVQGIPKESQGRMSNFLGKIASYSGQNLWGEVSKDKGLLAITAWKLAQKGNKAALLTCFPETGRTHQIRVHLAGIGHPILGDSLYNKSKLAAYQPKRCLLHAAKIEFTQPITGAKVSVEAPLPADFLEALATLNFAPFQQEER